MNVTMDPTLKALIDELKQKHGCHTVILYGSRARGDFTAQSDYDLMGVRKSGKKYRSAEKLDGIYIDIFVFPEKEFKKVDERYIYMSDGQVVFEKQNYGTQFIGKLKKLLKKKFQPLPPDEIRTRQVWLHKMYERACQGDLEGLYRRAWLQEALLPDYFVIRKKRFWGSKLSFIWLKKNDPQIYRLFEKSLSHPRDLKLLKRLVQSVSKLKRR